MTGAETARERGEERKLFALSTLPVGAMLVLHGVHLLVLPLLAGLGLGAAEMHHAGAGHASNMNMAMSADEGYTLSWMGFFMALLNVMALYYAGKLVIRLWRTRKGTRRRAAWMQAAVATISVAAGMATFIMK